MVEGSFVTWLDGTAPSDPSYRYGIVDSFAGSLVVIFTLDRADEFTKFYNEPGDGHKHNVKVESNVMPDIVREFGGAYGVYSKTYDDDGIIKFINDGRAVVIGSAPVEYDMLRLLRDHEPGREELQKTYSAGPADTAKAAQDIPVAAPEPSYGYTPGVAQFMREYPEGATDGRQDDSQDDGPKP